MCIFIYYVWTFVQHFTIYFLFFCSALCYYHYRFELIGIIYFISGGHYVAYIHRSHNDTRELHNDLAQKINTVKIERNIKPSLIYICLSLEFFI